MTWSTSTNGSTPPRLNELQWELLERVAAGISRAVSTRDLSELVLLRGFGLISCARCDGDHYHHRPVIAPAGEAALKARGQG